MIFFTFTLLILSPVPLRAAGVVISDQLCGAQLPARVNPQQGRAFGDCFILIEGCLPEKPKVGKARDQRGLGRNKCGK